jgi:D-lactate dehydrogenase
LAFDADDLQNIRPRNKVDRRTVRLYHNRMNSSKGKKFDVLFFEAFFEERELLKKYLPEHIAAWFTEKTIQESDEEVFAPIISIRTQSRIPSDWVTEVKAVLSRSTGYDHLRNTQEGTALSIAKGYLPSYCSRSVAEHALLLSMLLLSQYHRQKKQFMEFDRSHITGREIFQKNILVAGVGSIGEEFVKIARGLGCSVKGFDRERRLSDLTYVSLKDGLAWADILICALSLNNETMGLLNTKVLSDAKEGLLLVNVSRGEITPLKDLDQLLESGKLAGIGLDVFEFENDLGPRLRAKNQTSSDQIKILKKWSELDRVVLTPHNAFNTLEALERKCRQSIESLLQFQETAQFKWMVNEEKF